MFFFGPMKLKDKRVDKMLAQNGVQNAETFYSPVQIWLYFILMILLPGIGIVIPALGLWGIGIVLVYTCLSYLLYVQRSNSFALTEDTFYILNPSWPFGRLESCRLEDIHMITFGEDKIPWLRRIFIWSDANFLEITTHSGTLKYACAGLELDAFDENFTEKTLDDLRYRLEARSIPVTWNLID